MKRTFAALMKLYPPEYQGLFGDEMAAVFEEARRDRRDRGWVAYVLFLGAELFGILHGAASARQAVAWRPRQIFAIFPFLAGGIVSIGLLRSFLYYFSYFGHFVWAPHWSSRDDISELLTLAAISVVLIAGFSIVFVINVRLIAHRRHSKHV